MTRFILYFKRFFFLEYLYPSFFGENVQNQHCFDENLNRYSPEIINTMFYRDHCVCHTMMFAYCVSQRDFSALLMDATSQTSFFSYFTLPSFLSPGSLTLGLVRQCQTIHGRDRTCTPPRLPGEWITVLLFIILGIISLTVTCGLVVMSHWHREASRYARWIAFTGSTYPLPQFALNQKMRSNNLFQFHLRAWLWDVVTHSGDCKMTFSLSANDWLMCSS